ARGTAEWTSCARLEIFDGVRGQTNNRSKMEILIQAPLARSRHRCHLARSAVSHTGKIRPAWCAMHVAVIGAGVTGAVAASTLAKLVI
ncbi:MAG: hypothetical protein ACPIOQ_42735, partial [Promethearchaeia archaeon]